MNHLIVTFGCKQCGKTSSITALYGYYLTQLGVIPNANIDPSGKMSVIYNKKTSEGIYFDIDDDSPEIIDFKSKNVWPHIKHASFADALKNSVSGLFGIDKKLIYGTDVDKNTLTHIKWEDVFPLLTDERKKYIIQKQIDKYGFDNTVMPEYLTIREVLQIFGTDICRTLDRNCHIRSAINTLIKDPPTLSAIPDGRFANEFEYFDSDEAKELLGDTRVWRVKYLRNAHPDNPPGEQGLPEIDHSRYDLIIDNRDMSVLEKNDHFIKFFISKGVLS